jgi:hypothetical protein
MSGPNPSRQKSTRATLESVFSNATNVWVIHYSCESFIDRPDGRSPRITSIAVRQLASGQTFSFSIHQVAEVQHVPFDRIEEHYDELEKRMLEAYFVHVSGHRGTRYLHWNMRDINYGFAAIEHRYHVLEGAPFAIPDDAKIDLSRLLIDLYGNAYIDHPRLPKLMAKNHITALDLLSANPATSALSDAAFARRSRNWKSAGAMPAAARASASQTSSTRISTATATAARATVGDLAVRA